MSFAVGAWIAAGLGGIAGVLASRIQGRRLTGTLGALDAAASGLAGAVFALLSYGFLSLLEGWTSFFRRRASPMMPLLLTTVMIAATLVAIRVRAARKPGAPL